MKIEPLLPCACEECENYEINSQTACSRVCLNKISSNIARTINIKKGEQKLAEFYANNPQPICKNPSCDNLCYKIPRYWKWSTYCCIECKNKSSHLFKPTLTDEQKQAISNKRKSTTMLRYGVEHISLLDTTNEKRKQTMLKNHGVEFSAQSVDIQKKRTQTNLERYGVEHPSKNKEVIKKQKETMIERYGVEHALQVSEFKDKQKQTNLERYGVEFSSGLPEFLDKRRETMIERYGVEHAAQLTETVTKRHQTLIELYGGPSSNYNNYTDFGKMIMKDENFHLLVELNNEMSMTEISITHGMSLGAIQQRFSKNNIKPKIHYTSIFHKQILAYITDLGITNVTSNRRNIIPPFEIDICIDDTLLIECNGLYWHSERCIQDRNYHLNKTIKCEQINKQLLHIWQHDWDMKTDICKSIICSNLKIYDNIVYGRNTSIIKVGKQQESEFLFNNHIQGHVHSTVCYGLLHKNELVAIMSFGTPRYNDMYQWELLRFCTKIFTKVIGGANKLFKAFIIEYSPNSIISNCHRHLFSGGIYKTLGFSFSHFSKPSYYYTKNYKIMYNRMKFQKHKLPKLLDNFDPNLTEWENMMNNGWDRIWDCGNSVWSWMND